MQFLTPANIVTVFITINFFAFAAFGIDKMKAEAGSWRVQESTLLMLAFIGGSPVSMRGVGYSATKLASSHSQASCAALRCFKRLRQRAAADGYWQASSQKTFAM